MANTDGQREATNDQDPNNSGSTSPGPRGEQTMINRALPKDTNAAGDIFGGWYSLLA